MDDNESPHGSFPKGEEDAAFKLKECESVTKFRNKDIKLVGRLQRVGDGSWDCGGGISTITLVRN